MLYFVAGMICGTWLGMILEGYRIMKQNENKMKTKHEANAD